MAAIARRKVGSNILQVSADVLKNLKIQRMQLFRNIKCSMNVTDLLLNINILFLIHNVKEFRFDGSQEFQFIELDEFAPSDDFEEFYDEFYELKEQDEFLRSISDAKKTWDWGEDYLHQRYQSQQYASKRFGQRNPYTQDSVLVPFEEYPHLYIKYVEGRDYVTIYLYEIQILVKENVEINTPDVTLKNLFYNPPEWLYYVKHYLKYLPLFSDIIVGGSQWVNNVHAELDNRRKKQLKKTVDGNQLLKLRDYVEKTVHRNIGQQRYFVVQMRHQHAKLTSELSGFRDVWRSKGSAQRSYTAATDQNSLEMIDLYNTFVQNMGVMNKNESQIYLLLKQKLQQWKLRHSNIDVKNSTATFSKQTIKCLKHGYTMPRIGFSQQQVLKFFLVHELQQLE